MPSSSSKSGLQLSLEQDAQPSSSFDSSTGSSPTSSLDSGGCSSSREPSAAIPRGESTSRGFRKRTSFGSLSVATTSITSASVGESSDHRSRSDNNPSNNSSRYALSPAPIKQTILTPITSSTNFELHHVSMRWPRRRHSLIGLTAAFMIIWMCWTVLTISQQRFQDGSFETLNDLLEPGGAENHVPSIAKESSTSNSYMDTRSSPSSAIINTPRALTTPLILGGTSHSIPLPLPKQKISVVLMNFSRPRMIRESSMMRTLLSHPNVDEVLLLHANPKTAFEFVHPKVTNIDAVELNTEMGLSVRFFHCQLAKYEWVLHLDDDMEFTTEALNELIIEYERNPKRIVGRFGRDITPGNSFNGYNSKNRHKSTEVVLTKLMLMERDMCSSFFEYAHLVWNDVILHNGEGPLWNGEDIFMSLVANHVYGPPKDGSSRFNNYAMDWLDVWQTDDSLKDYNNGKYDISGGMTGLELWNWRWWQTLLKRNRHYAYRGRLWRIAKERLKELGTKQ